MAARDPDEAPSDWWESTGAHLVDVATATIDDDGRVHLVFEMDNGDVINVGDHAGMTWDYLADLFDDLGDDMYEYLADQVYEHGYGGD